MSDSFFNSSQFTSAIQWPSGRQPKPTVNESDQWLRKINLTIYDSASESSAGKDLTGWSDSQQGLGGVPICLRVVFQVRKSTNQSPNLMHARVYNLHPNTANKAAEFRRVSLSAGYRTGRYGEIFRGTLTNFRMGKENPTDTYLELEAGDGDTALGFDSISQKWAAGTENNQIAKDYVGALQGMNQAFSPGHVDLGEFGKQKTLRSTAALRMARDGLRDLARAGDADLFIDDGKVNVLSRRSYMPGEAAVLSPATGLIGMPEVTPQGIVARCLLNPDLKVGGLVKIDTKILSGVPYMPGSTTGQPLSEEQAPGGVRFPVATWGQQLSSAFTSPTGTYKILLLEHSGDIRGNPWYSDMVCAALDASGNIIISVDLPWNRSTALGEFPGGGSGGA